MSQSHPGDHYCLFTHFPIDPTLYSQLPIQLYKEIYLAPTPHEAINRGAHSGASTTEHVALGAWVYPGHGLGMGSCHACLKIDASVPANTASRYFWTMLGALYLAKPIHIKIGGSFTYGDGEDGLLGRMTNRIDHRSNICLDAFFSHTDDKFLLQYDKNDLAVAGQLFPLILECMALRQQMPRPYYILKAFFEAVLWERLHYASSSFCKLFPMFDAFAGNPSRHHANRVSTRFGSFLSDISSAVVGASFASQDISARLKSIWDSNRPPDLHGYVKDLTFPGSSTQPIITPEIKDLFDLMEIGRVAVIKILLLPSSVFEAYCQIPIPLSVNTDDDNEKRNNASIAFFAKNYPSPKEAFLYTDLLPHAPLV
jgi:hypothetical protein